MHPIELANIALIILGVVLLVSGPYIIYRTGLSISKGQFQTFSGILNLVIAVLFTLAGFLFIRNNLRGNPLAEPFEFSRRGPSQNPPPYWRC